MQYTDGWREVIIDAVATAVRYEGYQVEEAYNGRDASPQ